MAGKGRHKGSCVSEFGFRSRSHQGSKEVSKEGNDMIKGSIKNGLQS